MADIQGFVVVDDDYRVDPILDVGFGYEDRNYDEHPLGGEPFSRMNLTPTFDKAELLERIAEKTAKKSWVSNKCDGVGLKVKNQSRSNYCWNHAPVRGMEINYLLQGGDIKVLSAFWGAAQIKRGRNQGGYGIQACKFLHERGVPLESFHEPMDFSVNNDEEVVANAKLHQLVTWEDLDPQDMMAIFSKIVLDQPVTVGIPAWGHEVLVTFLAVEGGEILPGIDNSWSPSWGTNGRGLLRGRMKSFSEAGAVSNSEPSAT